MHRLDFKEASEHIKAVDAELEALLSAVWDQSTKACQRDLCFLLAKYPYAHFVSKDGKALSNFLEHLRSGPADRGPSSSRRVFAWIEPRSLDGEGG
jgi:hypothetical protein